MQRVFIGGRGALHKERDEGKLEAVIAVLVLQAAVSFDVAPVRNARSRRVSLAFP